MDQQGHYEREESYCAARKRGKEEEEEEYIGRGMKLVPEAGDAKGQRGQGGKPEEGEEGKEPHFRIGKRGRRTQRPYFYLSVKRPNSFSILLYSFIL